jgi:uncharacterized protein
MITSLLVALAMGLTGSLHCAGMCGAIMWVVPFHAFSGFRKAVALTLYHVARVSVYAGMAVVLYAFRDSFNPRIQQYVSVAMGAILLVAGLISFLPGFGIAKFNLPWGKFVQQNLGKVVGRPTFGAITMAGALNGLLPCGLVYMALSATVALPSVYNAIAFVYAFGLGTKPMLVSIALLRSRLHNVIGAHSRKLVPVVVFFFGCVFILRGLNLGIPYLSPKVEMANHKVVHSCCHKPQQ